MGTATSSQASVVGVTTATNNGTLSFDHEAALEACGRGERFALRALWDAEAPALLATALRIVRDRDLAHEAVFDGLTQAWKRASGFRRDLGSGRAWLHAMVRQQAMAQARRLPGERATVPWATLLEPGETWSPQPTPDAALAQALQGLDAPWRAAVLAIHLDGHTLEQEAAQMDMAAPEFKAGLREALLRLGTPSQGGGRDRGDSQLLAGEHVLGSLTPPEQAGVMRRLARDERLLAEVYGWQDRLASLLPDQGTPGPPLDLRMHPQAWPRMVDRLGVVDRFGRSSAAAGGSERGWWHGGVLGVGASLTAMLCFGLGLMLVWGALNRSTDAVAQGRYMAVLNSPQEQASWVLVGSQGGEWRVTPLSTQTPVPAGQQLVLWVKGPTDLRWQSLGRVWPDRGTNSLGAQGLASGASLPALQPGQVFELTLEPQAMGAAADPGGTVVAQGTLAPL